MKKIFVFIVIVLTVLVAAVACVDPEETVQEENTVGEEQENMSVENLTLDINGKTFTIALYDNATTKALTQKLPLTLDMQELNSNEKYAYLSFTLPTDAQRYRQIQKGDVLLYGNSCLVVFYKTFNTSYSYTPIGRIVDTQDLESTLGKGSATAVWTVGE